MSLTPVSEYKQHIQTNRMRTSCNGCRESHIYCNGIAPKEPGLAIEACYTCHNSGKPCEFILSLRPGPVVGSKRARKIEALSFSQQSATPQFATLRPKVYKPPQHTVSVKRKEVLDQSEASASSDSETEKAQKKAQDTSAQVLSDLKILQENVQPALSPPPYSHVDTDLNLERLPDEQALSLSAQVCSDLRVLDQRLPIFSPVLDSLFDTNQDLDKVTEELSPRGSVNALAAEATAAAPSLSLLAQDSNSVLARFAALQNLKVIRYSAPITSAIHSIYPRLDLEGNDIVLNRCTIVRDLSITPCNPNIPVNVYLLNCTINGTVILYESCSTPYRIYKTCQTILRNGIMGQAEVEQVQGR